MNGRVLALGSVAALAAGAALSRRGSRSVPGRNGAAFAPGTRWFHGSPSCNAVLESGIVRPSAQVEKAPTLASALRLYDETISSLDEDERYDARHAWRDVLLTPMRGFAYATHDPAAARKYADSMAHAKVRGCVVEVVIESGARVVPDEDWLGFVASMELFGQDESRVPVTRGARYPDTASWGSEDWNGRGFAAWRDQLAGLLPRSFVQRLGRDVDEAVYLLGDFDIRVAAPVGREVIRQLLLEAVGRAWLQEGADQFAPEIACEGPMRVRRRILSRDMTRIWDNRFEDPAMTGDE